MNTFMRSRRGLLLGLIVVFCAARFALAQLGAAKPKQEILEFTQQEVQAAQVVPTLNDLAKQRWEIFQVVPVWTVTNANGGTDMVPKSYQIFGRRPVGSAP
jgi:hypothetical protein